MPHFFDLPVEIKLLIYGELKDTCFPCDLGPVTRQVLCPLHPEAGEVY